MGGIWGEELSLVKGDSPLLVATQLAVSENNENLAMFSGFILAIYAENDNELKSFFGQLHHVGARDAQGNTLLHVLCGGKEDAPAAPPSADRSTSISIRLLENIRSLQAQKVALIGKREFSARNSAGQRPTDLLSDGDPRVQILKDIKALFFRKV